MDKNTPQIIVGQYQKGTDFKAQIGRRGIYEQNRINERFYVGDHWYGANVGANKPLVRRNIIRRIADYKISSIGSAPVSVHFSAEGVPENVVTQDEAKEAREAVLMGEADFTGQTDELEINTVMGFLNDYGETTMERLKFNDVATEVLRRSYISGTAVLYTYWDDKTETGLYADEAKQEPIMGDIAVQILNIENVVFGDPNLDDVQKQPYIILSQRMDYKAVRREMKRNRVSEDIIDQVKPDGAQYYNLNAGTRGERELPDSKRVTVYTKLYKKWSDEDKRFHVMAVKCTDCVIVRKEWDTKVHLYPIAVLAWEKRYSSAYGDSEITYLVPNQIAINRALTAEVWSTLMHGMPIMLVDGDVITGNVTNDPAQVIKINGNGNDVQGAIRYVQPPSFAGQITNMVNDLATNTLSDQGATDSALGNVRPDNAQAIIQMREAAMKPLQLKQNQYYSFIEDVMRIWAEFWLNLYGDRLLKVSTPNGYAYVPFHAARYDKLIVNARVDVGASTLYSTAVIVSSLDALRTAGIIDDMQYLERMPHNIIPDKQGLIEDIRERMAAQQQSMLSDEEILQQFAQEQPELYQQFINLPPEEQAQMLEQIKAQVGVGQPQMQAQPQKVEMGGVI